MSVFTFGRASRDRLETCHPHLQLVAHRALSIGAMDFTVVCGTRGREAQEAAVMAGSSWVSWPHSRHNSFPSTAMDLAPWKPGVGIDWENKQDFIVLAGIVKAAAALVGVELEWGGEIWLPRCQDLPHYQLIRRPA